MVYDSTLKLLSFSEMRSFNCFDWSEADVAGLNENFDYCILRGSNYLHAKTNWRDISALLDRVKIPVIPFSIGAQAPQRKMIEIPEATINVWKAFADHCGTIGVRGTYTAEVLSGIGIHNVEVIGCPSMFRANDPFLQVVPKPYDAIRNITFSLRREIATTYTPDVDRYLRLQRKLILELAARFDVCASVHGEAHEKSFFYRDPDGMQAALDELLKRQWFESEDDPLLKIYERQLFYGETVSAFDAMVREKDLSVGFRVHGVLPAMANGTPAIGVDYDSRGAELYEALDVPAVTLDDIEQNSFEALYRPSVFDTFNRRFVDHYRRMRRWLERNGMAHNMIAA
ncbi:MAG: polysaccharide pyruvyl transferase family protein [Alphaproteobacteria bacterium]|nr:polysaccharide pyruvyl transferase family protein [Alphaproteobacteria bacterium]